MLTATSDAKYGGFTTGLSPVSWGSIDELFVNLTMPVKTLRAAARDGRLPVTYDTRTTFRRLRARATHAAGTQFRRAYYGRWCADAGRPTRFKPSSPSPADAVRDGSAKLGHPVQNVTREHGLTPLPR